MVRGLRWRLGQTQARSRRFAAVSPLWLLAGPSSAGAFRPLSPPRAVSAQYGRHRGEGHGTSRGAARAVPGPAGDDPAANSPRRGGHRGPSAAQHAVAPAGLGVREAVIVAGGARGRRSRRPGARTRPGRRRGRRCGRRRDLPQRGGRAAGVAVDAVERLVGVALHAADEQDRPRRDARHQVGEIGRRQVVGEHDAGGASPS